MKLRRSKRWVSRAIVALMTVLLGITVLALIFQLHFYLKTKQYYSQFDNSFGEPVFLVPDPLNLNDLLTTQGTEIVNQSGEEVVLEGVNLGGWLLQEYWMCPIVGNPEIHQWTHQETLQVLEERFGFEKSQKLMEIYQDNWITEWDIQKLASMGVNVLRVPFWYRNFMSDPEGTWLTENMEDNPGFQKLDWVIETAGKYGIYVILDMHGCPGARVTTTALEQPGNVNCSITRHIRL